MLQRPAYQSAVALITLIALAGGVYLLAGPGAPPGMEISLAPSTPAPAIEAVAAVDGGLLDLNAASAADIAARLPDIGPVLAGRIVAYREANGGFSRVDQLMEVNGIGAVRYERVRDLVTVGD